jgi:hypothetical protein
MMTLRSKLLSDRAKLAELRSESQEQSALQVIQNEFQIKGRGRSGGLVEACHGRRVSTIRDLIAERFRLEREQPLAPEDVTSWYDALVDNIREIAGRAKQRLLNAAEADWNRDLGGHLPEDLRSRFERDIDQMEQEYLADARLLREERRSTRTGPSVGTMITVNVNQSQVAALNLGQVIGNIEGTVSGLNAAGQRDLAEAIKTLTETITDASSLPEAEKREAIELVSALGEELARPPDQARSGLLRTVAARLRQIVSAIATAQGAYEALKLAARSAGYELP